MYSIGDEADDILHSLMYDIMKKKFDSHFVKCQNVICKQVKFNQRRQEAGESLECFITALYGLAEHYQYTGLHNEICDRIIVGLQDAKPSESLQLDSDLTLQKVVTKAKQAEAVETTAAASQRLKREQEPERQWMPQERHPFECGHSQRQAGPTQEI